MTTLLRLVCLIAICLVAGCAPQPRKSIFLQSPAEILETVRLLTQLDGGTRLKEYEDILGAKFRLTVDRTTTVFPVQGYVLDGNAGTLSVAMDVHAAGLDLQAVKVVELGLHSIDKIGCIPEAEFKKFASTYFQIFAPFVFNGFVFTTQGHRQDLRVFTSFIQTLNGMCVSDVRLYYGQQSDAWGH